MQDTPSKRAAYMRHLEMMKENADVRALQERRVALQQAQMRQMDYERVLGTQAESTIPPLRTFRHQMNDRRRMAQQFSGQ